MKPLLLAIICGLGCSLANGAWKQVASLEQTGEYTAYLDDRSLKNDGGQLRFWLLSDYPTPRTLRGQSYSSIRELIELDCAQDTTKSKQAIFSAGSMGGGAIVFTLNTGDTAPIVPGTLMALLAEGGCLQKK